MNIEISAEEYVTLCKNIHSLIVADMENAEDVDSQFAKFCTMYIFFTFLRGEAFTHAREPVGDQQKELYGMEKDIYQKLQEVKLKLNNKEKAMHYFDELYKGI